MKTMRLVAALAVFAMLCLGSSALFAQEAKPKAEEKPKAEGKEGKEEPKEEEKELGFGDMFAKMFKGLDGITGKIELTDADVKLVLKHWKEFDDLTKGDEKFENAKNLSFKEAYEYLLKNEKYQKWAKEKSLDGEKFLKQTLRLMSIQMKLMYTESFEESAKQIEDAIKEIEGVKEHMEEAEYKEQIKSLNETKAQMQTAVKALKAIPGPTDAEKKVFEANEAEIKKMMGNDGAEEGGDDGMDG